MSEADVVREQAWIELEAEPPESDDQLMTEEEFEEEVQMAAEGRWEELDLDPIPGKWEPMTMEELRASA